MADEPAPDAKEELAPPDTLGVKGATPEGEAKPEGEKAAEEKAEPIKYEDFKLPEGAEVDAQQMSWFKEFAGERKLSQEDAQVLVDRHVAQVREAAEAPIKLWVETQKQWSQEVQNDKEIGGDNLPAVKATVAKALDRFGSPELREALILTGAGNNPAIIRFVHRMAKELVEGGAGPTGNPRTQQKSAAERMYPNLPNGET